MDAEKIASLTDQELASLGKNVKRLGTAGTGPQRMEAERLGPMIDEEIQKRQSAKSAAAAARRPKKVAKEPKEPKAPKVAKAPKAAKAAKV